MGKVWSNAMTNTVLQHVEKHKGDHGLYMSDKNAAIEDALILLAEQHPTQPVSKVQLRNRFEKICSRYLKPEVFEGNDLFLEGRCVLVSPYDQATLLQSDNQQRSHEPSKPKIRNLPKSRSQKNDKNRAKASKSNRKSRTSAHGGKTPVASISVGDQTSGRTGSQKLTRTGSAVSNNVQGLISTQNNPIVLVEAPLRGMERGPITLNTESTLTSLDSDVHNPLSESFHWSNYHDPQHETMEADIRAADRDSKPALAPQPYLSEQQRHAAVRDYLLEDPARYLPSSNLLENLRAETVREILSGVRDLLDGTETGYEKDPQLYTSLSYMPFFDICKCIYGVGTKLELLQKSTDLLLQSSVHMKDFLRAAVAAAVNDWVFDGRHENLPSILDCETETSTAYESELAGLYPELHKQILRKSHHTYIASTLDLSTFVTDLSSRFSDAIRPFLFLNLGPMTTTSVVNWRISLQNVFKAALRLKCQTQLPGQEFVFHWPRADERFDGRIMEVESASTFGNDVAGKVKVALFPALVRRRGLMGDGTVEGKEGVVFPASVILQ